MGIIHNGYGNRAAGYNYKGTNCAKVFMNGVQVFPTELHLTIPQQSSTLTLSNYVSLNNPYNATKIYLTNNLTQPKMVTGDLSGLDVELINNGEIQANVSSGNAFEATSSITLTNNGWIRGAGGSGGNGGTGGKGANTSQYTYKEMYNMISTGDAPNFGSCCFVWHTKADSDHIQLQWNINGNGNQLWDSGTSCGCYSWTSKAAAGTLPAGTYARGSLRSGPTAGTRYYYGIKMNISESWTGGNGGGGGSGGVAQYYQHSSSGGSLGSSGAQGSANHCYESWSWTAGKNNGGTGGTGGNGGSWGTIGNTGNTGGTGGGGVAGGTGGTGGAAGNAITGNSFLSGSSSTGSVNGNIV